MDMVETKSGNVLVLKVCGRLDSATAPAFEAKLAATVAAGQAWIVVDCTELNYLSSAGLRAFLGGAKQAKSRQGKLAVGGAVAQVREIFDLAGFAGILPICATVQEAVNVCVA